MSLILSGTDGLSDVDGSAATPAIRGTDANTGIFFPAADTIAFAEGGAEAMRITSAGDVGIGISSPDSSNKLQVAGDIATSWDANKFMGMKFGAGGAYKMGLMLNNSSRECKVWSQSSDSDDKITFYTGPTPSERMRIDSSGVVMVGKTTNGNTSNGFQIQQSGTELSVNRSGDRCAIFGRNTNDGAIVAFFKDGNTVGSISVSGSNVAYNTSSDYRLKENITPMNGALAKVAQLNPVTYKWKVNGLDGEGFIAHELAAVVPQCVLGEKDAVETYTDEDGNESTRPVYQGVDTSFLVATLTAAIQEQQALITALTARITALEQTNA